MSHRGEVVSLLVPHDLLYDVRERHLDHLSAEGICGVLPLLELLFLLIQKNILLVRLLPLIQQLASSPVDLP